MSKKIILPELSSDQVSELLKHQVSQAIEFAFNYLSNGKGRTFVMSQAETVLEDEIHRILDGEMIYPLI